MKTKTNFLLIGLLSLLVGTAFASPLLISELEIRPYVEPLPKGPTADISASVVYANFSVGDTSVLYNKNVTDISYFVVLNITNNSDEWAVVNLVEFDAAEKITQGAINSFFWGNTSRFTTGWEAKGAWVDGKWYNLTWASIFGIKEYENSRFNNTLSYFEPYWIEGVQIKDTYVGGELTASSMNMNGTWVDVTGRINVTGREEPDFSNIVSVSGIFFSEMKMLVRGDISGIEEWLLSRITTNVALGFSNLWAPHQSRLIAISTNRKILSELLEPSRIELLETGPISFRLRVHHRLNGTLGIYESSSFSDEIKPVQMELTEDGYLYNIILADDQMFVMDSFGVEVFIEPRS